CTRDPYYYSGTYYRSLDYW
nr:immunoglobulin heavy chain junction region [Macaca mulatta]